MSAVTRLSAREALWRRCGRRKLKKGYRRHVRPRYRVIAGRGSVADQVVCRACATPGQMDAIRAAERR